MDHRGLILASGSPRRKELLASVGVRFDVIVSDVDETVSVGEAPEDVVLRLAVTKAKAVARLYPGWFVLGADTIVVLRGEEKQKDEILGKPIDEADAVRMLERLSGRAHFVITGFSLSCPERKVKIAKTVTTEVDMRALSKEEIEAYVASGEPLDKAGAYAIQGKGGMFISEIKGSYSNVVGLPLAEVVSELAQYNLWAPRNLTETIE